MDIKYVSISNEPQKLRFFISKNNTLKDIEIDGIYRKQIECIGGRRYLYKYSKCTISDMDESENIKQISDACTEKLSDCTEKVYSIKEV